jgi:hypothetical protein
VIKCLAEASKCAIGQMTAANTQGGNQTTAQVASVNVNSSWVKARQDAIKSMQNLLENLFPIEHGTTTTTTRTSSDFSSSSFLWLLEDKDLIVNVVFDCYLHGLNDYSIDSKGDSGSRVREASLEALERLFRLCARFPAASEYVLANRALVTRSFANIVQQAVERIDRTRSLAGRLFFSLLYHGPLGLDSHLPQWTSTLKSVFQRETCDEIDWNLAHMTLPLFVKLLRVDELQANVLSGFVFSIGSLTESLVKPAEQCFLKEMKQIAREDPKLYAQLHARLLDLCRSNLSYVTVGANTSNENRLATSLIKTYDLMTQNDLLIPNLAECLLIFLFNVKVTKDMIKLILFVDLFGDVLLAELNKDRHKSQSSKEVRNKVMFQMMLMLCHQYPRVRKYTAAKLFEMFMNVIDQESGGGLFESEEAYAECTSLLTDTDWSEPLEGGVRDARNRICDLTKTPKPVVKKAAV